MPVLVNQFLEAVDDMNSKNNSSITTLNLLNTTVHGDALGTFLRKTTSVKTLFLRGLWFEETPDPVQTTRNFSISLAQNTSLEMWTCQDDVVALSCEAFRANVSPLGSGAAG